MLGSFLPWLQPGTGRVMSSPVQQKADLPLLSKCFFQNILPQPLPAWLRIGGEVNYAFKGLVLGKQTPGTQVLQIWQFEITDSLLLVHSLPQSLPLSLFTYPACRDRRKIEVEMSLCINIFCVKGKQAASGSM